MEADEAICPRCDYIIDASFLEPGRAEAQRQPARPAAPRPAAPRPAAPRARPAAGAAAPRAAPGTPARGASPLPRPSPAASGARPAVRRPAPARPPPPEDDEEQTVPGAEDALPQRPLAPAPAPRAPGPTLDGFAAHGGVGSPSLTGKVMAPEELLADAVGFWRNLGRSDRIAFSGACLVLLSGFLPWKETAEDGELLGLVTLGLVALVLAGLTAATLAVRTTRAMPKLPPFVPWLAQLGSAALGVLWCVIFLRISHDATEVPSPIGNFLMERSSPTAGAWLGLLGALTALVGTLLGLKEKQD